MYSVEQIENWLLHGVGLNPTGCFMSTKELLEIATRVAKENGFSGVGTVGLATQDCNICLVK